MKPTDILMTILIIAIGATIFFAIQARSPPAAHSLPLASPAEQAEIDKLHPRTSKLPPEDLPRNEAARYGVGHIDPIIIDYKTEPLPKTLPPQRIEVKCGKDNKVIIEMTTAGGSGGP
jgi:hypothetical protein